MSSTSSGTRASAAGRTLRHKVNIFPREMSRVGKQNRLFFLLSMLRITIFMIRYIGILQNTLSKLMKYLFLNEY